MLSWDLKGPRTHSLEGSSGRPRGTQSSKTSSNRKDGDPPSRLGRGHQGGTRSRLKLRGPTCVHIYYSTFKQRHSRAPRRSPLPWRQGHPKSKAKRTQQATTKERGFRELCHHRPKWRADRRLRKGAGGRGRASTQVCLGQGCVGSPTDMLTADSTRQALGMCQGQYR